jgi:DNA-binding transcriptional regulator LsrR (DeoR family)
LGEAHHQYRHDISTEHILKRLDEGATKVLVAKELGVSPTFIHRRLNQARAQGVVA